MSFTKTLQSNTSIANRRVLQIKQCTPSALSNQIDHDAAHAFLRFCEWVFHGGVELVPGMDPYKKVVKLHKKFPEYLRERRDAVFAGLARGADTGRHKLSFAISLKINHGLSPGYAPNPFAKKI